MLKDFFGQTSFAQASIAPGWMGIAFFFFIEGLDMDLFENPH
jgi:hypothetical protein